MEIDLIILAKPVGRGKWAPLQLEYFGPQTAPMLVAVGDTFMLGGVEWRVYAVLDSKPADT